MKREERIKKPISFSFLEKGTVVAALFVSIIAGYFMPVGLILKFILGAVVFISLIVGWMFFENMAPEEETKFFIP